MRPQAEYPVLPCQMDRDRWFADTLTRDGQVSVRSAIAACKTCPALAACMEYAEKVKPRFGVWAGRYYAERRSRGRFAAEMEGAWR